MSIFQKLLKKPTPPKPYYGATDTGIKRPHNEDQFCILENHKIFMVADGMGGYNAGEVASQIAIDTLRDFFTEERLAEMEIKPDSIPEILEKSLFTAHVAILQKAADEPACQGMGTTIVLAYLQETVLHLAHVGDSRAYIINQEIKTATQDHSTVAEMVRAGHMLPEEVHDSPLRSQLSQALGAPFPIHPEYTRHSLAPGDLVLLCSDGLWDMIGDEEIADTVKTSSSLEEAGQTLIQKANNAGGLDNITVVLFRGSEN